MGDIVRIASSIVYDEIAYIPANVAFLSPNRRDFYRTILLLPTRNWSYGFSCFPDTILRTFGPYRIGSLSSIIWSVLFSTLLNPALDGIVRKFLPWRSLFPPIRQYLRSAKSLLSIVDLSPLPHLLPRWGWRPPITFSRTRLEYLPFRMPLSQSISTLYDANWIRAKIAPLLYRRLVSAVGILLPPRAIRPFDA